MVRFGEGVCLFCGDFALRANLGRFIDVFRHEGIDDDDRVEVQGSDGKKAGMSFDCTFLLRKVRASEPVVAGEQFDRMLASCLRVGQPFQLECHPKLVYDEKSQMVGPPLLLSLEQKDFGEMSLSLTSNVKSPSTHWKVMPVPCAFTSELASKDMIENRGKAVETEKPYCVKHWMTNSPLRLEGQIHRGFQIRCGGHPQNSLQIHSIEWKFREATLDVSSFPKRLSKPRELLAKIREIVSKRGGDINVFGILEVTRQFRILDIDNDQKITKAELNWGLPKFGIRLDSEQLDTIVNFVDKDKNGIVDLDEFLIALRGPVSKRRLRVILEAFKVLDVDGNGEITLQELCNHCATNHFTSMSHEDSAKEFARHWWDKNSDEIITKDEFVDHFKSISASIDNDDHFELMIRNAFHISGGSGWTENTSNLRSLVIDANGKESVKEV